MLQTLLFLSFVIIWRKLQWYLYRENLYVLKYKLNTVQMKVKMIKLKNKKFTVTRPSYLVSSQF